MFTKKLGKFFKTFGLPLFLVMLFPLYALAADQAAPALVPAIMALWAAIRAHAQTSLTLVPVFQILRSNEVIGILSKFSGRYLQVVIACLTAGGFIVDAWAKGGSLAEALVVGLLTSGGAMLIFDAFRSIKPATTPAA